MLNFVSSLSWSPDGQTLATGGEDGTAKHPDRALTKFNEAIALQPDLAIPVNTWNRICWDGEQLRKEE